MSRTARSRIAGSIGLLVSIVVVAVVLSVRPGLGPTAIVMTLIAVQAASLWAASRLQPSDGDEIWVFDEAVFIAAAMILPWGGVLVAFILGSALGQLLDRLPPRAIFTNFGISSVAIVAGLAVASALQGLDAPLSGRYVVAVVLGAVTLAIVNEAGVALYLCAVGGRGFAHGLVRSISFRVVRTPFLIAAGLLAGTAGRIDTWAALFAVPLFGAAQYVLAEHTRAERDRERTQGLFGAATEVHASVRTEEVNTALLDAARRLLRCNEAMLSLEPPKAEEWGAPLTSGEADRWLVVREPRNGETLDGEAVRLLKALTAVGSSALENARLVEEIEHRALHDSLTGLANQVLFGDRVSQCAATARRGRERFAVMVLDLDSFKKVNDSLGHSHGNELLRLVGDRLVGAAREIDTIARLGADHFTLLLPGVGNPDAAAVMAENLLAAVRRPVTLNGHELFMTASAGIAFFPDDGAKPEELLRNADSAMHRAKEKGKDSFQVYSSGMNELAHLRLVRESELHNALERDELRLRYQPQIDLRTGRIIGVEALVRWEHPVLGLIGPAEFVPLAEESGLIVALDSWVLDKATRQLRSWIDDGLPPVRMAVNFSGRHFQSSERFLETVHRALAVTGIDPTLLELAVTESIAVGEEDGTALVLQKVREVGVKVAIDDFGTGYSMLARLQRFPIDCLKIDRSFVMQIPSAHGEAPIVAAMIAMARSMKIAVVAEGVETLEQQTFLKLHGCDAAQGFLFSHPVEAEEIAHLLRTPSVGLNLQASSATPLHAS